MEIRMSGEKSLSAVRAAVWATVLLGVMLYGGCGGGAGATPGQDVNRTSGTPVPGTVLRSGDRANSAGSSMRQAFEQWSQPQPAQAGMWTQAADPSYVLWGRAAPEVAYRRAVEEAQQRYERERKEAGRTSDPTAPRTAAVARLRYTKALEAAEYTRQHARWFGLLPADKPSLTVKAIQISANTESSASPAEAQRRRLAPEGVLYGLPAIYVDANQPKTGVRNAQFVYDFRGLYEIITAPGHQVSISPGTCAIVAAPGHEVEVSLRTIEGFKKYVLSQYQETGSFGVQVPTLPVDGGEGLKDGVLALDVVAVPSEAR
jgi:hypothetical protein